MEGILSPGGLSIRSVISFLVRKGLYFYRHQNMRLVWI